MNNSKEFTGELLKRAIDSEYLEKRTVMNKSFQLYDFAQWAIDQINPKYGIRVLDVGCGRGAQAIPISEVIGKNGEITLIDLSQESMDYVINRIGNKTKARGFTGSMDSIASLLGSDAKGYDIAYSVYALYYANKPIDVLSEMYDRLIEGGSLCIIGPDGPHGLVEIARKFHTIPAQVDNSFGFRSKVVEPFFKEKFDNFSIRFLKNPQSIVDINQFLEFYRKTTYYKKEAECELKRFVENQITKNGRLCFNKYSYAIIAEKNMEKSK